MGDSMKSVVQAAWLLAVAFGNIIVIIVASAKALDQASEFFMFAVLMILDMFFLMFLAYRYTPRREGWQWRQVGLQTTTSRVIQTCDLDWTARPGTNHLSNIQPLEKCGLCWICYATRWFL